MNVKSNTIKVAIFNLYSTSSRCSFFIRCFRLISLTSYIYYNKYVYVRLLFSLTFSIFRTKNTTPVRVWWVDRQPSQQLPSSTLRRCVPLFQLNYNIKKEGNHYGYPLIISWIYIVYHTLFNFAPQFADFTSFSVPCAYRHVYSFALKRFPRYPNMTVKFLNLIIFYRLTFL